MLGFWEALESATTSGVPLNGVRARRDGEAQARARAFYDEMVRDEARLAALGVEVTLLDGTVSFRRNGYSLVHVAFGAEEGAATRIVSAVAVHLKLEPASEDVPADADVAAPAGRWLGLSMELIAKNPGVFARFGLS